MVLDNLVNGSGSNTPSTSYLDPSTAKAHLKTYERNDGLSLKELMDSTKVGSASLPVPAFLHAQ